MTHSGSGFRIAAIKSSTDLRWIFSPLGARSRGYIMRIGPTI
jgi:hypothetical protein